jgi:hypothetical protein
MGYLRVVSGTLRPTLYRFDERHRANPTAVGIFLVNEFAVSAIVVWIVV